MAKETAISKRAKISQAQQYVLLAVLGTAFLLGAAIVLIGHFQQMIAFNSRVISEEDASIKKYSDVIKGIGVCKKPSGDVYTDEELKKCVPDAIEVSSIPGTLRANIINNMAKNEALNSVPKEADSACINPSTGKNYTYEEMNELYNKAENSEQLSAASTLIQSCSALRIIPDALPASKNEEALLSSLNKIFIISNLEPESLRPSDSTGNASFGTNLGTIGVRLSIPENTDTATTVKVIDNIERSIREFNITRASIEWSENNTLDIQAQANAYYINKSSISEVVKTLKPGDQK